MLSTENASIEIRDSADSQEWRWAAWCEKAPERFVAQLNERVGWVKYRVKAT